MSYSILSLESYEIFYYFSYLVKILLNNPFYLLHFLFSQIVNTSKRTYLYHFLIKVLTGDYTIRYSISRELFPDDNRYNQYNFEAE